MIRLVTLYGTGDTYLACALFKAFTAKNGPAEIVCKAAHQDIPEMFRVPYRVDDQIVAEAEHNQWRHEDNLVYLHPSCPLNYTRPDQFTFKGGDISQADMYRALMDLPLDVPLTLPRVPKAVMVPKVALLIYEAKSWPNTQPAFWHKLGKALNESGYVVNWNMSTQPLAVLLHQCAESEWVIGPQCGVMSILTTARYPCRKSFCTPTVDGSFPKEFPVKTAFPYAYVTKFAGEDFDVDQYEITNGNHDRIIQALIQDRKERSPDPVQTVTIPVSPGDFLDRLAVLHVKLEKFSKENKRKVAREHAHYWRIYQELNASTLLNCGRYFDALVQNHRDTFDLCSSYVPDALNGRQDEAKHAKAITLNKERVSIRQTVDEKFRSAFTEVKDYYK